jgi:hypothetical protein
LPQLKLKLGPRKRARSGFFRACEIIGRERKILSPLRCRSSRG